MRRVIGILGTRRLVYGLAGLGVFAAVGLAAAGTRPGADAGYYAPTLVAAAAGALTLILLLRAIPGSQPRRDMSSPPGPPGPPTRTGGDSS